MVTITFFTFLHSNAIFMAKTQQNEENKDCNRHGHRVRDMIDMVIPNTIVYKSGSALRRK